MYGLYQPSALADAGCFFCYVRGILICVYAVCTTPAGNTRSFSRQVDTTGRTGALACLSWCASGEASHDLTSTALVVYPFAHHLTQTQTPILPVTSEVRPGNHGLRRFYHILICNCAMMARVVDPICLRTIWLCTIWLRTILLAAKLLVENEEVCGAARCVYCRSRGSVFGCLFLPPGR